MQNTDSLDDLGFCLLNSVLNETQINWACAELDSLLAEKAQGVLVSNGIAYGIRNLLSLWPEVVQLLQGREIQEFIYGALGEHAAVVRGLYFDKPPGRTWTLPWHRDRTIAVCEPEQIEAAANKDARGVKDLLGDVGFTNWTRKAGVPHVTAPPELLSNMLTLRFSLDPMTEQNGPLVVMPGSHQVTTHEDADLTETRGAAIATIRCDAGDVFVMRPLLAHSSIMPKERPKDEPQDGVVQQRRVVHLELSNQMTLPAGLRWQHFLRLAQLPDAAC